MVNIGVACKNLCGRDCLRGKSGFCVFCARGVFFCLAMRATSRRASWYRTHFRKPRCHIQALTYEHQCRQVVSGVLCRFVVILSCILQNSTCFAPRLCWRFVPPLWLAFELFLALQGIDFRVRMSLWTLVSVLVEVISRIGLEVTLLHHVEWQP